MSVNLHCGDNEQRHQARDQKAIGVVASIVGKFDVCVIMKYESLSIQSKHRVADAAFGFRTANISTTTFYPLRCFSTLLSLAHLIVH